MIYTVTVDQKEYNRICGSLPVFSNGIVIDSVVVYTILTSWINDNCPYFVRADILDGFISTDCKIKFDFNTRADAIIFWRRWLAPIEYKKAYIFPVDELKHISLAIDWLEENLNGSYVFVAIIAARSIGSVLIIKEEPENIEELIQFKLTHVGE